MRTARQGVYAEEIGLMKLIIAIMVFLMMWMMPASASEAGATAHYDDSRDRVVVSGSAVDEAQKELVSLTVYFDKDSSKTYTGGDVFQYITTLEGEDLDNGSYSFKLVNNADRTKEAESGYYIVRLKTDGGTCVETSFLYVSESGRIECLGNINSANSVSELDSIIKGYNDLFGIDMVEYESINKTDVLGAVIENKPQGGYQSLKSFGNTVKEYMGLYALKKASTVETVEEILGKYDECLGIKTTDLYDKFETMKASDKKDIYKKFIGKEYPDAKTFRLEFDSAVSISIINNAKKWSEIKLVLENYAENLAIDLKYLNKCNLADLAVELAKKAPFESKEMLSDAIKAFAEKNSSTGGGGSSGGGGGGGGGGSSSSDGKHIYSAEVEIPDAQPNVKVVTKTDELASYEWARTAVEGLMEMGAVKGNENGLFLPGNQITREEFLKILVEAFGLYESGKECNFDDVAKSNWAYSYIACAVEKGIVNGIGENRFGIGQQITRQDMAVMIERASGIANIQLTEKSGKVFTDSSSISDYARGSVEKLAKAGVINGYDDGSFKPLNLVIRAEAAVMIYNVVRGK